ncbi:ATP-binding protein [Limosilactobacillus vaginalis]|uniref:AAA family ATPase n=1 Tax=Limosilactobacillus vaginalis TaxID=1633 RepID=UPI002358CB76|nr:AAA family ATPase [Limosilactobacillus vaginalis]WCT58649.1 AAA family ATPase [Limosilactobacillus vaginalis]
MYFYFAIYNIDTIIFDDPITSIDANNRIFILDLINRLIDNYVDKSDIGILIFTHSDYDFHNFAYFYKDARRFIIKKDEHEHSEVKFLTKDAFLNFSNTYKSSFEDIVEFATKSRNKLSVFNNYLKYGNQARYVLETHARSNYEIHYATESGIGQLAIYYNITASEENAVKTMLNTINSLSHGTSYMQGISNEPFAPEIQKAIRILILLIYRKDKQHVKCMSGDYWGTLKNAIHTWHYLDTSK